MSRVFWFLGVFWGCALLASGLQAQTQEMPPMVRALWVECEGTNQTLSSRAKIEELLTVAARHHFNLLYVQLFRGNHAWFENSLVEAKPAKVFLKKEQVDMLSFLIEGAHRRNIEVHGWVNLLRVVRNPEKDYPVIRRLGNEVVTRNGQGVSLWDVPANQLPDGGYWLDPGSLAVQSFVADLAEELMRRYPRLDGIHLDFVRLPSEGISSGSLWDGGKGYGYGKESVTRFQRATGLNPLTMKRTRENCERWDDWRRSQVTEVVREIKKRVEGLNPATPITAAVLCWPDRAYLSHFQDWGGWLEEGIVDGVVTMNYGTDTRLVRQLSRQAIALKKNRQVTIGLGAYLLQNDLPKFQRQVADTLALGPDGIAFFSYDAMLLQPQLFQVLSHDFFRSPASVPRIVWKPQRISPQEKPPA